MNGGKDQTRKRRLLAILFSDVVGSTSRMHNDEPEMLNLLEEHDRIVSSIVEKRKGRVVKFLGDGFFAVFTSGLSAVDTAIEIQEAFHRRSLDPTAGAMVLRIGIHVGDVVLLPDGDILGDKVNIAARLQSLADHGGICLSEEAYRQIENHTDRADRFERVDHAVLKGIDRSQAIYQFKFAGRARKGRTRKFFDGLFGQARQRLASIPFKYRLFAGALLAALLASGGMHWRSLRSNKELETMYAAAKKTASEKDFRLAYRLFSECARFDFKDCAERAYLARWRSARFVKTIEIKGSYVDSRNGRIVVSRNAGGAVYDIGSDTVLRAWKTGNESPTLSDLGNFLTSQVLPRKRIEVTDLVSGRSEASIEPCSWHGSALYLERRQLLVSHCNQDSAIRVHDRTSRELLRIPVDPNAHAGQIQSWNGDLVALNGRTGVYLIDLGTMRSEFLRVPAGEIVSNFSISQKYGSTKVAMIGSGRPYGITDCDTKVPFGCEKHAIEGLALDGPSFPSLHPGPNGFFFIWRAQDSNHTSRGFGLLSPEGKVQFQSSVTENVLKIVPLDPSRFLLVSRTSKHDIYSLEPAAHTRFSKSPMIITAAEKVAAISFPDQVIAFAPTDSGVAASLPVSWPHTPPLIIGERIAFSPHGISPIQVFDDMLTRTFDFRQTPSERIELILGTEAPQPYHLMGRFMNTDGTAHLNLYDAQNGDRLASLDHTNGINPHLFDGDQLVVFAGLNLVEARHAKTGHLIFQMGSRPLSKSQETEVFFQKYVNGQPVQPEMKWRGSASKVRFGLDLDSRIVLINNGLDDLAYNIGQNFELAPTFFPLGEFDRPIQGLTASPNLKQLYFQRNGLVHPFGLVRFLSVCPPEARKEWVQAATEYADYSFWPAEKIGTIVNGELRIRDARTCVHQGSFQVGSTRESHPDLTLTKSERYILFRFGKICKVFDLTSHKVLFEFLGSSPAVLCSIANSYALTFDESDMTVVRWDLDYWEMSSGERLDTARRETRLETLPDLAR